MKILKFIKINVLLALITVFFFLINCSKLQESIEQASTNCAASECHPSTPLRESVPVTGKHNEHLAVGLKCSKCHYNYIDNKNHKNGINDARGNKTIVIFGSKNPSGSWKNSNTTCENLSCHGSADWYGTGVTFTCLDCHDTAKGAIRQIVGAGGDFNKESHHVIDYNNRNTQIVQSYDCEVCHNMDNHMSGTVRLKDKDNSGNVIVYDPGNPSTLEPFCLSCHDDNGAVTEGSPFSPFSSTNTLGAIPNEAGRYISTAWNNNKTIHKDNNLTCAGTGEPGTGCHGSNGSINMHGAVSRGLLTKNMALPVTNATGFIYDYNDYKLCFDCHENYPGITKEIILGYQSGGNFDDPNIGPTPYYTSEINSLFREHCFYDSSTTYSDCDYDGLLAWDGVTHIPLHNYHLLSPNFSMVRNMWAYRGDSGMVGRSSCTTCHNVHGTDNTIRSTHDDFGITAHETGPDEYKRMTPYIEAGEPDWADSAYHNDNMMSYPIYCSASCHSLGRTNYWHTPSGE